MKTKSRAVVEAEERLADASAADVEERQRRDVEAREQAKKVAALERSTATRAESLERQLRDVLATAKSVTARTYLATLWRLVQAEESRSSQTSLKLGDE